MQRLYRSTRDRMLTGLCGGIAYEFGINPTLLRVLFLVAIPLTSGAMLPIYFIASLVIPRESAPPYSPYDRDPYRDGYQGRGPREDRFRGPHDQRAPRPLDADREFERSFAPHRPAPRADLKKRDVPDSGLDAMMEDIEKKALKKEVEELKQKLAQYENEKSKGDL